MIEKIMKAVKSGNKKRGRNITIGAVVGMLLSCTAVMGADVSGLEITKGISGEIEFKDKDGNIFDPNNPEDLNNPYTENIWEDNTYTNNSVISVDNKSGENAYGVKIGEIDINIENKGAISVTNISNADSMVYGYGIKSTGKSSITNSGLITTTTSGVKASRGIGIEINGGSTTNRGLITATASGGSDGYGCGIILNSTDFVSNSGFIIGSGTNSSHDSAVGIENRSTNYITNSGFITGLGAGGGSGSYGIYSGGFANITNNGLITGRDTSGRGDGIQTRSRGSIVNSGVIYGKRYAIYKFDGTLNDSYNYGILVSGSNGALYGVTIDTTSGDNKIVNYGLAFTDDGSGSYKNYDTVNTNGNFGNVYENVAIGETKYTIRNVQATIAGGSSGAAITDIKSFAIKDGELYEDIAYDNDNASGITGPINDGKATIDKVILNGIENTLKVVGDNSGSVNSLSNSIINAYGTAVEFDSTSGGSLTLKDTIVNGGVKDGTSAILGSDDGSKTDTLVLEGSTVNGNIDMQNGTNIITAGKGTTINGDINLGDGENKITLGDKVYINGDITIGNASNGVDFTGGSEVYLNGEVAFTDNADIFTLGEKSAINKDIDMKDGNDELTIGAGSIVNGKLDGGTGDDILTFGTNSKVINLTSSTENNIEDSINISHDIAGFENINVGAKVTFASDITVSDATGIKIGTNGALTLKVNSDITDSASGEEKITGHALYTTTGTPTITSEGGTLLLALNKLGNENIVSFGTTTLGDGLTNDTIGTTSKLHIAERVENTDNEVIIRVKSNLPDYLKYPQLNKIYHGILSVDDLIGNFNVEDDEKLSTFLGYLNDIYAGNPYSYSSELSRKSAGMFRDIVVDNIFRPEKDKWMIYGGLTHVDGGTKDTYYGKGYYTYDIGSSDMDADTKITGAYMLGEYGISDTLTSGVVIGGNKLKSDLSNSSKVDGSAMYLGAYAKKYIGNLKVTAGAGFQYGDYDADRMAVNRVASDSAESVMKYS
ncbi:MAG: autotransporter domain-containing protein, partial [Fusobacterium ulcerans]|uniref:beta strand repeat-containing protein n=1 Tax=Fusobacterium ulcerans TaxID=861 RepID=UPI003A83C08D